MQKMPPQGFDLNASGSTICYSNGDHNGSAIIVSKETLLPDIGKVEKNVHHFVSFPPFSKTLHCFNF